MNVSPMSVLDLASEIERFSGMDPLTYSVERMHALESVGDHVGAERFRAVAERLGALRS